MGGVEKEGFRIVGLVVLDFLNLKSLALGTSYFKLLRLTPWNIGIQKAYISEAWLDVASYDVHPSLVHIRRLIYLRVSRRLCTDLAGLFKLTISFLHFLACVQNVTSPGRKPLGAEEVDSQHTWIYFVIC
jgi:hypothetical protein